MISALPCPGTLRMRVLLLCLLLSLAAFPLVAAGDPAADSPSPAHFDGKGLKLALLPDFATIAPGQTFHLGLWIQHDPGYHTYWSNPGLAGVPTKLVPSLPPGFTAGELLFPPPQKVSMAAIRVHGYEQNVLVALPVTAPATLPEGPVTIPVEATWMCCQRTCNPGFASLSITLRCGPASIPDPESQEKFQSLLASQPPPLNGWTLTAVREKNGIRLTAAAPDELPFPDSPQFFSLDNLICSHPVQKWTVSGNTGQVLLTFSDFPPADPSSLKGVLTATNSWRPDKFTPAVTISVPFIAAPR